MANEFYITQKGLDELKEKLNDVSFSVSTVPE